MLGNANTACSLRISYEGLLTSPIIVSANVIAMQTHESSLLGRVFHNQKKWRYERCFIQGRVKGYEILLMKSLTILSTVKYTYIAS